MSESSQTTGCITIRYGVDDISAGPRFETGRTVRQSRTKQSQWSVQALHDDTFLVFAASTVRVLAIWVPLQYRSRSTGLNDRGI